MCSIEFREDNNREQDDNVLILDLHLHLDKAITPDTQFIIQQFTTAQTTHTPKNCICSCINAAEVKHL